MGEAGDGISVSATSGSRLQASVRMAAVRCRGHSLEAQVSVCLVNGTTRDAPRTQVIVD